MYEGFNSTYQVLTKFHKVCTKSLFCFRKKKDQKTFSTGQEKTTVINVFIFNKRDFQRLLLPINFKSIRLRAFYFLYFNLRSVKIPALKLCY